MGFSADFTAIDFETANRRRDSACQLAAVVVRKGEIVDERMWMIRPDPFFFSPGNIRIHGIRPSDVEDSPDFGDCWGEIAEYVGRDCLIAHNASFDIGVLIGCLERHQCAIPELQFSCTRLIAKQTWPDRRRYGLKPLANWLGVDFRHHDALEDSRACAKILTAAGIASHASSMEDLERKLGLTRGKAGQWGVSQASKPGSRNRKTSARSSEDRRDAKRALRRGRIRPLRLPMNPFEQPDEVRESSPNYQADSRSRNGVANGDEVDLQRLAIRAEFIQPLRGKQIVIFGRLNVMTNEQAIELTTRSGGQHQDSADASTNCVVVGATEVDREQVDTLVSERSIEVLTESEFLRLFGN